MKKRSYITQLSKLLDGVYKVPSALDTVVSGLSIDSREVKKGDLFIALSGENSRSTDFIEEAISSGANAVIVEGTLHQGKAVEDGNVVEIFIDDLRSHVGKIADRFFQSPSNDMQVVGVTGTNGKTSVVSYLASFMSLAGYKSATIGTLGFGILDGVDQEFVQTGHTTPDVVAVHRTLADFRDQDVKYVSMEVSSHGLDQGRVEGVNFSGAVFTNLSHEHLDYHGSMEEYARAKQKLFEWPSLKFAIANVDDPYSHQMLSVVNQACEVCTYSLKNEADVSAVSFKFMADDRASAELFTCAQVQTPKGKIDLKTQLIGAFNLSNVLAVVSQAVLLGDIAKLEGLIDKLRPVSGRMQLVTEPGKPIAVIDYAHTPDALENVLNAVKPYCLGRLNVVFGCGGDRDKAKRQEMAKIAEKAADWILVTDDNPRNENPESIVADILRGFSKNAAVKVERDRKKAIESALSQSVEGDLVLVAGKGHETWQEVAGEKNYFSDIEEVKRVFAGPSSKQVGASL